MRPAPYIRLSSVALGVTTVVLVCVLFRFNPVETWFYPSCWFHRITGLLCPGCGSLRAVHQLTHGHVMEAMRMNPVLVLALPLMAGYAWQRWRERNLPPRIHQATRVWLVWLGMALLLTFGVLRNLPGFIWLRP